MSKPGTMESAIKNHWPEYLMEAGSLALFMISACVFTALLEHPSSFVHHAIPSVFLRRMIIGIAMGLTLIAIVFSPWGRRSGAHLNPSFTWTFFRLGKIQKSDAFFYTIAQFAGGIFGVLISQIILGDSIGHPSVQYAITIPGPAGPWIAFVAEIAISFFLMLTVLIVSNNPWIMRYTPFFAGSLVALYITFEAPYSGMSMNAARTIGSAFSAKVWTSAWIYFIAPTMGMLLAGEVYVRIRGIHQVFCAKYHHDNSSRCIFSCNYGELIQLAKNNKAIQQKENHRMFSKTLVLTLALGLFSLGAFADHATLFKVRVENVSTGTTLKSMNGESTGAGLSPGLFFLFDGKSSDVFVSGHPDHGMGLESQAEDGNPAMLAEAVRKQKGVMNVQVFNTPVGMENPGPIGPGGVYEFTFTAKPGTKLMLIDMFGQSNDLFYAPDPMGIELFDSNGDPVHGDITSRFVLWDAGTEVNQEPGFGPDQAPRQKSPNTGASEKKAIEPVKDSFMYPPTSSVLKVTISHQ